MGSPTKLNSGNPASRPVTSNLVLNAENRDVEREQLNRILNNLVKQINASSSSNSGGSITFAISNNDGTISVVSNGNTFIIGIADGGVSTAQLANNGVTTAKIATVNSNVGTFGSATQTSTFTVNAQGQVTGASNTTISIPASAISDSTVVGRNFLTAPNPSAIRFVRVNADNSVTFRSDVDMRTDLGLVIGTNVQAFDSDLAALAANATNGLWARTGAGTGAARTITGTANEITVTNGNGTSGNPTISIPTAVTFTGKTVTGGTYNSGAFNGTVGATTPSTGSFTTLTATGNATLGTTTTDNFGVRMNGNGGTQFVAAGNVSGVPTVSAYTAGFALAATLQLQHHGGTLNIGGSTAVTGTLSCTGNATLGDATSDTHTANGSLTVTTNTTTATYFAVDTVVTTDANTGTETISVDLNNGAIQKCERNGNHTLNVTGPSSKHIPSCTFYIRINTTGGITSFGSNVYTMTGAAQSLSTNRTRVINGFWDGSNFYIVGLVEVTGDVRPS